MIKPNAPINDVLRELNSPNFDPIKVLNSAINESKPLKEQHPASVELMATFNDYSQTLSEALQQALEALGKTEKRVPHEISLLHNDVLNLNNALRDQSPEITSLVNASRRSAILSQMDELQVVRGKLNEVKELLELAKEPSSVNGHLSAEQLRKLAVVFQGTPDEAKWNTEQQSYYNLLNKLIN